MNTSKLNILVFDDSECNRLSATKLLGKEHNLMVVGTYDEAQHALTSHTDFGKARKEILPGLLKEAGLPIDFNPWSGKESSEEDKAKFLRFDQQALDEATTYPNFDVVMTDLLVPASSQAMGEAGKRLIGQEMPLGTTIALLALCAGVKKVAVVTDMNHHHHPASASFDCFGDCRLEGVDIMCTNNVNKVPFDKETSEMLDITFLQTTAADKKYPRPKSDPKYGERQGIIWGKDWKNILENFKKTN